MPDNTKPETKFRDYEFTSKFLSNLDLLNNKDEYFLNAIGYKLPHITIHMPQKYYNMYKNSTESFKLKKKELKFPSTAPAMSYRCCAEGSFRYMNEEGTKPSVRNVPLGDINAVFPQDMRIEMMQGYAASISFIDTQVGRILDRLDELNLWNNVTIVFTGNFNIIFF